MALHHAFDDPAILITRPMGRVIGPYAAGFCCTAAEVAVAYARIKIFLRSCIAHSRMPLSEPAPRTLRHRRTIAVEAYSREDGLWDIEARLTDHKDRDFALATGLRKEGSPIHELWLRLTIDENFEVHDAEAVSDWVPYPGICDQIGPEYRQLIGLNLRRGFRHAVRERLGGASGCTHLTELCSVLPTAAIQAFAGVVIDTPDTALKTANDADNSAPPFQLGHCHALRFDGEAVRRFYPRWFNGRANDRANEPTTPVTKEAVRDGASTRKLEPKLPTQQEGNHA
ncbi:hypothetical protein PHO31112_01870 [Pandoraea horticolens]|uniref:DUF2889 domain-containing protein n=2 Tax=Pandoraea horticolens TaxID=2508298 RepID=A0A5E4UCM2_9BURK|nr:hypothetical protein PHO31112_01870 [Pandoraea horticolens]